jgi:preprotein translocase SecE subunit
VARNRKRAKERRARRPQPNGPAPRTRNEPPAPTPIGDDRPIPRDDSRSPLEHADEPPSPLEHAAPDVELADAQIALASSMQAGPAADGDFAHEEDVVEEELEEEREERAAAARPAVTGERPSLLARLIGFLQGSWRELQRVQWPDRRQVAQATSVVIGFVIVAGVFLGLSDLAFSHLVNYILYGHS